MSTDAADRLSPQMREVLEICLRAGGKADVSAVVRLRVARGEKRSVVQATLSRTLRRMWRAGLVELSEGWGKNATERHQEDVERLERARGDPAEFYRGYAAWATLGGRFPQNDRFGSAELFLAAKERAAHGWPRLRVTRIELTPAGAEEANSQVGATVSRMNGEATGHE